MLDVRKQYGRARQVWITSDFVLDETITRVFARRPYDVASRFCEGLLRVRDSAALRVERIDGPRFDAAWELRRRYQDKPGISFTDFTSFVVMRELDLTHALTRDAHYLHVGLGFVTTP